MVKCKSLKFEIMVKKDTVKEWFKRGNITIVCVFFFGIERILYGYLVHKMTFKPAVVSASTFSLF